MAQGIGLNMFREINTKQWSIEAKKERMNSHANPYCKMKSATVERAIILDAAGMRTSSTSGLRLI